MAVTRKGIEVFGIKEIQDMFAKLPKQIKNGEGKAWNKFWKETSKPMQRQAQINANGINSSKKELGNYPEVLVFLVLEQVEKLWVGILVQE